MALDLRTRLRVAVISALSTFRSSTPDAPYEPIGRKAFLAPAAVVSAAALVATGAAGPALAADNGTANDGDAGHGTGDQGGGQKDVPDTYVVKGGDTVSSIAAHYGLSTASVLALNGLSWRSPIFQGQTLTLRGGSSSATTKESQTNASDLQKHSVAAGETIYSIAGKYGVTRSAIMGANGLSARSTIYVGQVLTIPAKGQDAAAAPQQASASTPAAAPASAPASASASASPSQNGETHTIAAGETLYAIAASRGIHVSDILSANGLTSSSIIYPGQKLTIPAAANATIATPPTKPAAPTQNQAPAAFTLPGLDSDQSLNAARIVSVGRQLGMSDRAIVIALATAMQESGLHNLTGGDRDSVGLFQQRPSQGWGSAERLLDPTYAITAYFLGVQGADGKRALGLMDIPNWSNMQLTDAAQSVQLSAAPLAYGQWEAQAKTWLEAIH